MTNTSEAPSGWNSLQMGEPFDPAKIRHILPGAGHGKWLDMHFHAVGDGWVELALPWREHLVGIEETGVIASGPIISLMDNACGLSVWQRRGIFAPQVTVDLRVDYMRPATPGKTVIGRGECYKLSRTIGFVRGIAYEESPDDPVAHAAGTFMVLEEPA